MSGQHCCQHRIVGRERCVGVKLSIARRQHKGRHNMLHIDGKFRRLFELDCQIEQHVSDGRVNSRLPRCADRKAGNNLLVVTVVHEKSSANFV